MANSAYVSMASMDADPRGMVAGLGLAAAVCLFWALALHRETRPAIARTLANSLALALLVIAIAGPKWGIESVEEFSSDAPIWLIVDVSRSMGTKDALPTRLGLAKQELIELLPSLAGRRVGLIAFAGVARAIAPPTTDAADFSERLSALTAASAPVGGTDLSAPFRLLAARRSDHAPPALAILVSDGGHEPAAIASVASAAKAAGVVCVVVGVGDPDRESPIPLPGDRWLSERGAVVRTKLEEAPLRAIAEATAGAYAPARTGPIHLASRFADRLAPTWEAARKRWSQAPAERFAWFACPAILLSLWAWANARRSTAALPLTSVTCAAQSGSLNGAPGVSRT